MSEEIIPGFINQVQPPEFLAKIEPLTVIKNEPPEWDEEIADIKEIDIVSHLLPEDSIKSETVTETTFETKHVESFETQVFVKTENAPFVKIENITEGGNLNKPEDTGNKSINKAIDQRVVEVQDKTWRYHCDKCAYKSYHLCKVKRHKRIHVKPEETQYFYCYHCSYKSKHKWVLRNHILRHFKNGNVPFYCYICNFVTQSRDLIITHIKKHTKFKSHETSCEKDTKFINHVQQPELPVFLAKIEPLTVIKNEPPESDEEIPDIKEINIVSHLLPEASIKSETVSETTFETKHLESAETQLFVKTENAPFVKIGNITENEILNKPEDTGNKSINKATDQRVVEVQDNIWFDGWRFHCDKCAYKTRYHYDVKKHKIIHLKPEETQYFYCYHCSFKSNRKGNLRTHITKHFEKENVPFRCYICHFVTLRRHLITTHLRKHTTFKSHEISHEKDTKMYDQKLKLHCDNCTYKTYKSKNLKMHKIIHLKPEEIQYFHCHHCSFKSKQKGNLQTHIFRHFKKEEVMFHCYVCNFMTPTRNLIIRHIEKHSKVQIKSEINERHNLKPEEIRYFYCHHCSYKSKKKFNLQKHIFRKCY